MGGGSYKNNEEIDLVRRLLLSWNIRNQSSESAMLSVGVICLYKAQAQEMLKMIKHVDLVNRLQVYHYLF